MFLKIFQKSPEDYVSENLLKPEPGEEENSAEEVKKD